MKRLSGYNDLESRGHEQKNEYTFAIFLFQNE